MRKELTNKEILNSNFLKAVEYRIVGFMKQGLTFEKTYELSFKKELEFEISQVEGYSEKAKCYKNVYTQKVYNLLQK